MYGSAFNLKLPILDVASNIVGVSKLFGRECYMELNNVDRVSQKKV